MNHRSAQIVTKLILFLVLFTSAVLPSWAFRGGVGGGGFHGGDHGGGWGYHGGGWGRGWGGVYLGLDPFWDWGYPYGYPYSVDYDYGYYGDPYPYSAAAYADPSTMPAQTQPQQVSNQQQPMAPQPRPQTADNSHHDLTKVNDLQLELRTLLDQKLKDGSLTRAQHNSEIGYLDEVKRQIQAQAEFNKGYLTGDQEHAFQIELDRVYYETNGRQLPEVR